MGLKSLAWGLAALMVAGWGWSQRHAGWVEDLRARWDPPPPVHIRFDNGTVREARVPASGPELAGHVPGLKKCVGESHHLYTDGFCPAGTRVAPIQNGTVNVTSGAPVAAQPAVTPAQRSAVLPWMAAGGSAPHDEPSLQDRRIETAVNR